MANRSKHEMSSVIVIGGGLAGLTATLELARAGRPVTLCESAPSLGGRARTRDVNGFRFNLGPRALYIKGKGKAVLDALGVSYRGHKPPLSAGCALSQGKLVGPLPLGLWSLMICPWMSLRERVEVAGFLAHLPRLDPDTLAGRTVSEWLAGGLRHKTSRGLIEGLLKLTTYCADHQEMCASSAVRQLQIGLLGSVLYLDGGWQTLIDSLRQLAIQAGAQIKTAARVQRVEATSSEVLCETVAGEPLRASSVILAVGPVQADRILESRYEDVRRAALTSRPVHAACLDVALERLPRPERLFALGIDCPYYVSVHSAAASLAPEGGALVHVLRYLRAEEPLTRNEVSRELEGVLDQIQPGWHDRVVDRQLLPKMTVCHDIPSADRNRASHRVASRIYVAGDWVGREGLLADASLTSASRAAQSILEP